MAEKTSHSFWRAIMKAWSFFLLVVGVALCLTGANPAKEDQAKKDKDQMQGTWTAVGGEQEGKEFSEDGLKQGNMKMTFKGDRYTFEMTGNQEKGKVKRLPPAGFEPATYGLGNRRSIP